MLQVCMTVQWQLALVLAMLECWLCCAVLCETGSGRLPVYCMNNVCVQIHNSGCICVLEMG